MRCPPLLESFDSECQSNSLLGKSEGQASGEVMQNELSHLKYVNRQLYAFAVDKILNNDTTCTTSSNKKRK